MKILSVTIRRNFLARVHASDKRFVVRDVLTRRRNYRLFPEQGFESPLVSGKPGTLQALICSFGVRQRERAFCFPAPEQENASPACTGCGFLSLCFL